jgi:dihydroneopterin aldolase
MTTSTAPASRWSSMSSSTSPPATASASATRSITRPSATSARAIADAGHIDLVETFAERLAQACFADARVTRARVRVEKPLALAPHAAAAGVEITAVRA